MLLNLATIDRRSRDFTQQFATHCDLVHNPANSFIAEIKTF